MIEVGELVKRKIKGKSDEDLVQQTGKYGIVIERQFEGHPSHMWLSVDWPQCKKVYIIAESLVEKAGMRWK